MEKLERKKISRIYNLIMESKEKDFNFFIRLLDGKFKDKKIIYKALQEYQSSLSPGNFKIDNTKEVNDEIYRNDQAILKKMFSEFREKFQDQAFDEEREMVLKILEDELDQMSRLMDKARRYVLSDYQLREEVWDIPGKIPEQIFSMVKYKRLEHLTKKYLGSTAALTQISQIIHNKSEKVRDYGLDRLCEAEGQSIADMLGHADSLPHWRYLNLGNYRAMKYQEYQKKLEQTENKFIFIIGSLENDLYASKQTETRIKLYEEIAKAKRMRVELKLYSDYSFRAIDHYICATSRALKPLISAPFTAKHLNILEEYTLKYNQPSPPCAKGYGLKNLARIREILNLSPQEDFNKQNRLGKLSAEHAR